MQKQGVRTVGIVDAVVGLIGVVIRIIIACVAVFGLVSASAVSKTLASIETAGEDGVLEQLAAGMSRLKLFFGLGIVDCILVGILLGLVLFVAGMGLMKNSAWGKGAAFGYAGGKLLLGLLTLIAAIVFFVALKDFGAAVRAMRETPVEVIAANPALSSLARQQAMTETQLLESLAAQAGRAAALGWLVEIVLLLSLVIGFFVAVLQFALAGGSQQRRSTRAGDVGYQPDAPQIGGGPTNIEADEMFKTQIQRSESPTITLQVYQGNAAKDTKRFELFTPDRQPNKYVIGRDSSCDLVVAGDRGVSGEHCSLKCDELGRVSVTDLDSSNGTFIKRGRFGGAQKITRKVHLQNGDTLVLGASARTQIRVLFDWALKTKLDLA